jgi:hypothetical protein
VLGYLDDLVIVPLGITITLKTIPVPVMERCRAQAREDLSRRRPSRWIGVGIIIFIWLVVLAVAGLIVWRIKSR